MTVIYEADALRELGDAAEYLARATGSVETGYRFLAAAISTEALIQQFPNAHPPIGKILRRCLLADFPYQIIYRVDGDVIGIFADAHCNRKRGYLRKRVSP